MARTNRQGEPNRNRLLGVSSYATTNAHSLGQVSSLIVVMGVSVHPFPPAVNLSANILEKCS
jgi:hypothetical protein